MTDPMELLYEYAEDRMIRGLLDREGEYANIRHRAGQREKTLRAQLDKENEQRLDDLLGERSLLAHFEGEALFRAGFQLAMELAR